MKAYVPLFAVIVLGCAQIVGAQGVSMYDQSYAGPVNIYGQPTFSVPPTQPQQAGRPPTPPMGLVPGLFKGASAAGNYLWGYMPAPVRGVQSPYAVPPGQANVTTIFVPGNP